jgi:diaminohydroxyphosphoribosylaminopyrimidine deaminase/5-amino-6-(5-phosphoribosylamino)uracil reductase
MCPVPCAMSFLLNDAPSGQIMNRDSAAVEPRRNVDAGGDDDDCDALWSICLALAQRRRKALAPAALDAAAEDGSGGVDWLPGRGWFLRGDWSAAARTLFDLYRPLLDVPAGGRYVIGHLGQSIDGRIATTSGDSCYINGQENLIHMHRLRALCDAVIVGAGTVVADDPQLTTRLVPGPDATRVVIDPSRRLTPQYRICSDGRCPTLVARTALADEAQPQREPSSATSSESGGPAGAAEPARLTESAALTHCGSAEVIAARAALPPAAGIDLRGLLDLLAARGLRVVLVEGGGITVSKFLEQRLLNRLQIAIAPVIIGSGRQGLQLPDVLALSDCLRPSCRQHQMGPDILWDLDLQPS